MEGHNGHYGESFPCCQKLQHVVLEASVASVKSHGDRGHGHYFVRSSGILGALLIKCKKLEHQMETGLYLGLAWIALNVSLIALDARSLLSIQP